MPSRVSKYLEGLVPDNYIHELREEDIVQRMKVETYVSMATIAQFADHTLQLRDPF